MITLQCKSLQASLYFSCLITLDYFLFIVSASNAYVSLVQHWHDICIRPHIDSKEKDTRFWQDKKIIHKQ